MSTYRPTLHGLPDDTAGRFAALREFLRRWHELDTGTVGRTVARVDAAEAEIRRRLPPGVREWIVLLDDLSRIGGWGLVLRDCWSLRKVPDCPAFSLLVQGEDDCHWGPMLRDLARDDPPTSMFVLDYAGATSRFVRSGQIAPRVSTWAIEFILSYLYLSQSLQVERTASKAALDGLRRHPPPDVVGSRLGRTYLFEFPGGLIHAEADSKTRMRLRCYAPFRGRPSAEYYAAADEFGRRVDVILRAAHP